ncbi:transporter substrate-binding domain-containing protein [uncultured Lacinutrix sp.]|uniref:response regulator n=1 Tax=uncultured Lacinutrix sp. TaxID=574032 RepID=UPI002634B0D4|nr:transporter substrate-binding domain-containing protein [uncultured Lacinutrix sp.]
MKSKSLPCLSYLFFFFLFLLYNCDFKSHLSEKEKLYLSNNPDIIVGIYIYYPPFEFINENGQVNGILIEYFNKLESNIDHTFKKRYYNDWQQLVKDAKANKIDVILEIQNTEERRKYLDFTEPVFVGRHIILTEKNSTSTKISDLYNKKICVCEDYSIEEYLRKKYPNITRVLKPNEKACIDALLNNEVDAFIGLESAINYFITKDGISNLIIQGSIGYDNELSFAINKEEPILSEIIKKGNNSISLEEKNEILNKWLLDIAKPFHKKASFWKTLLLILGSVLLLSFIFSFYLKQIVKKRTEELIKAKKKAEKNNELKTLFLQNISHEVRTPLNSIIGFASFLKENSIEEADKTGFVDTILQQSSNLTNILNNIIEISELTTTKSKPKNQALCLEKELNIIAEIYKIKAENKGLSFKFNNQVNRPESIILSDKSRLTKTISNLLDNAIKFTNNGSIILSSKIENSNIIIQITDTGIGIQSEKSKAIFDEFYQIEQELSKKYDGLGIGLTIAKENIKSLKGSITLDTNLKGGTSFTITLPYNPAPNDLETKAPKLISSTLKILIAEDMKLNYLVLQKMLDKIILDDKTIIWAKNGQEAIDYINESNFDIIFMDIKMPVLDGYEATKQIKAISPDIYIVAQTAYADEEDYNKAIASGFDGYLTKPINSNALKITLQDLFAIKTTSD